MCVSYIIVLQALNDYVVGYHDAVVLFGQVMRENLLAIKNQTSSSIIDNPFRSTSFQGINLFPTLHHKHNKHTDVLEG